MREEKAAALKLQRNAWITCCWYQDCQGCRLLMYSMAQWDSWSFPISLIAIHDNTSLTLSVCKSSPPNINLQLNLVFAASEITDLVPCATHPCFHTQWCGSEGTLDHETKSLTVCFTDVVPGNRDPRLLKQEMEMGSICRHSAKQLEPHYICFSLIDNGDQILAGKNHQKTKEPLPRRDMLLLMILAKMLLNSLITSLMLRQQHFTVIRKIIRIFNINTNNKSVLQIFS